MTVKRIAAVFLFLLASAMISLTTTRGEREGHGHFTVFMSSLDAMMAQWTETTSLMAVTDV